MHIYAKSIFKLIKKNSFSKLLYPKSNKSTKNKKNFLGQIIWELKSIKKLDSQSIDYLISAHPRFPLDILCIPNKYKNKRILVIHDYMQCIKLKSLLNIPNFFKKNGQLEILKRIYHTFMFKLSASRADYFIFNSYYTKQNACNWIPNIFNKKSLVLHPLPSFNPKNVLEISKNINFRNKSKENNIHILFVTGFPATKRSEMIYPIIKKLANKNKRINFLISIVGIHNFKKHDLNKNITIDIRKKSLSEKVLIQKYLTTDIFISTSSEEGFGIPLLDAITFNIFTIASSIPAYKEIKKIYKSKKLSLLSQNSSPDDYVEIIHSLIKKKKLIKEDNRVNNYTKKYLDIYQYSERRLNNFLDKKY